MDKTEVLILEVAKNPVLFDKAEKAYKETVKKGIGEKAGLTGQTGNALYAMDAANRNDIISDCFINGYNNRETRAVLNLYHGIKISERTLKRNLQTLGLRRRSNCDDYDTIVRAIQNELDGSGSCLGYRAMTIRLRNTHGLNVARRVVMAILRILDPGRVEERRKRRFSRRQYCSKGPNYLVHIDGYDKLKPFGFAIHGAICGYSRRILWLRVGRSNNDPYVTAYYFINFVEQIGGVPRCIRMDRGTENVFIEDIQTAFRWDHMDDMAGEKSVIYGSSHRNQRIERWWLTLRQSGGNFWMNLFKDMESFGLLSSDKKLEVECLRFCFTELLQTELDTIADEWNQHRLTTSRSTDSSVSGKPDLLYFLPEQNDTVDYKTNVEPQDTQGIKQMCTKPRSSGCEADFENLCETILQCNDKHKPTTTQEATDLYLWLVSKLSQ